jgi:hypothetical protein
MTAMTSKIPYRSDESLCDPTPSRLVLDPPTIVTRGLEVVGGVALAAMVTAAGRPLSTFKSYPPRGDHTRRAPHPPREGRLEQPEARCSFGLSVTG